MSSFMPPRKPCASASSFMPGFLPPLPVLPGQAEGTAEFKINFWPSPMVGKKNLSGISLNMTSWHGNFPWQFPDPSLGISHFFGLNWDRTAGSWCSTAHPRIPGQEWWGACCWSARSSEGRVDLGCSAAEPLEKPLVDWLIQGLILPDLLGITKLTKLGKPINQPYYQIDWGFFGNSSRESYQPTSISEMGQGYFQWLKNEPKGTKMLMSWDKPRSIGMFF